MHRPILGGALLLLVLTSPGRAQRTETGFLDRTVTAAGQTFRYQVYVPSDYRSDVAWPVILFLHGAGERGAHGLLQTTVGLGNAIRHDPTRYPAIVVFPQVPPDGHWPGPAAEAAFAALQETMAAYHTDPDRVYLTGLSLGGHGTWYVAYRHPDVFAAVAPVCGWVGELPGFTGPVPVVPPDSGPALPAVARQLAHVPIWVFHGEMDPLVPVSDARDPVAALRAIHADVRYTEYLGLGHNVWDATYGSDEFVHWLFAQRRARR